MVLAAHIYEGGIMVWLVQSRAAVLCILGALTLAVVLQRTELRHSEPAGQLKRVSELRMLCITMGSLGFGIGLVQEVGAMDAPSELGPAIALGLLSMLYAVTLAELCLAPWIDRIARSSLARAEAEQSPEPGIGRRAMLTDLLVLLVIVSVAGLAAAFAGNATDLLQPAALLILLAFAPINAAFHGLGGHHRAFLAGYSPESCTATQRAGHELVLRSARTLVYALGTLGVLIGLIHVLSALDNPDKVGKGVAVLLTCPLYAVAIAELFIAPRLRRLQAAGPLNDPGALEILAAAGRGRAPLRQAVAVIAAAMLLFGICLLAISPSPRQFHEQAEQSVEDSPDPAPGDDDSAR